MNFEIYCDESCLEALNKKDEHSFIGIGGVWLPSEMRTKFKEDVNSIKRKYGVKGELKWNKVTPKYLPLYKEIIDYFFDSKYLRFRVILVQSDKVDLIKFHNSDAELSFYKFYYQMIKTWIYDFNLYDVYLDLKKNRNKGRLKELERFLDKANFFSDVRLVQGLPSNQSLGIQLADLLTGIATAKVNQKTQSEAKNALIQYVESHLRYTIQHTPKNEEKFNVFKINLQGGW
ncbi:DUF3800 domain-containing protein [Chryseobacterium suipulveris]|uniref:DUF3800 domain-containing protein n=1 Tax=Chryseobacterium suipulveris TaxID=2929800 RepID=A0ABY4BM08_9FLAO|nr:DUF3800 domain-containing protein [Chryseobacterium suipulveris]UOE40140.1 DUF3800 domain-containing protein [Chryseobacterium suipulveris]